MVPKGKSLIFPTRAGSLTSAVVSYLLTNRKDVQRLASGRFTPYGHRLHTRRYDAGDIFPDMEFGDAHSPLEPDTGVWPLPLKRADFRNEDGWWMHRRSGRGPFPGPIRNGETLGRLIRRLPPGKYVVVSCRGFPRKAAEGFMARPNVLKREEARAGRRARGFPEPGPEARSDPGSLSATAVTDSRSGDSSRGWADSLLQSLQHHGETYQAGQPLSTDPKHRHRPRRLPTARPRAWHRRRKGPVARNTVEQYSDGESDADRGRKTAGSRLRRLTTTVTSPREAVRSFRKALVAPLRDPLRGSRRRSGSSSAGST